MGCGSSAEGPVTANQLAKAGMTLEDWVAIVSRVKGIVEEQEVKKMLLWFNSNFRGGVTADEFRWSICTDRLPRHVDIFILLGWLMVCYLMHGGTL